MLSVGQGIVGWSTFPNPAQVINCARQQREREQCACPINYSVSLIVVMTENSKAVNAVTHIGCFSMTELGRMQRLDLGSLGALAKATWWKYQWSKNTLAVATVQVWEVIFGWKLQEENLTYVFLWLTSAYYSSVFSAATSWVRHRWLREEAEILLDPSRGIIFYFFTKEEDGAFCKRPKGPDIALSPSPNFGSCAQWIGVNKLVFPRRWIAGI